MEYLWRELLRDGASFDDKREYGIEDLKKTFGLTILQAEELFQKFRCYEQGEC